MYSGHIIIQGCQPRPFEGNKYPELYTFHGLNFVWTHSCNECHSQSFIQLASFLVESARSSHFIQIITIKKKPGIPKCFVMFSDMVPSLACLEVLNSLLEGEKIIPLHKDDGWQVKFVSRDWRWMVTEVFILRMEVGVRRGWVPKGTRHWQIYPADPIAWAFSLFWILASC